jgi:hypothetical protein
VGDCSSSMTTSRGEVFFLNRANAAVAARWKCQQLNWGTTVSRGILPGAGAVPAFSRKADE